MNISTQLETKLNSHVDLWEESDFFSRVTSFHRSFFQCRLSSCHSGAAWFSDGVNLATLKHLVWGRNYCKSYLTVRLIQNNGFQDKFSHSINGDPAAEHKIDATMWKWCFQILFERSTSSIANKLGYGWKFLDKNAVVIKRCAQQSYEEKIDWEDLQQFARR